MRTRTIDGLLLVDKPAGATSHDVVHAARRALAERRIGHTGTLDPFATGLLVLLIGRATRLLPYMADEPKEYAATIRFGAETDTDDLTGVVTRVEPTPSDAAVERAIAHLTGSIQQMPPAYSAKQVQGQRAYAAARRGAPLDLAPVTVHVDAWTILARRDAELDVTITCGRGTYARALARDLGRLAGSAAHLGSLRRTRSGAFDVRDAVALDALRSGDANVRAPREAIRSLPIETLGSDEVSRVARGMSVPATIAAATRAALVDALGDLVAVADRVDERWQPRVVLRDA